MTNKRTAVRDLQAVIQEIYALDGLPDNLSTEAQLWDEIMKKEVFLMPEQLFPLIREVHGKEYPKDTPIRLMATEYSVERMDTKEISSIRADITVQIAESDIYHFECEIKKDKTMVIRMFEYDVHAAITYAEDEKEGYQIRFPHSAVLYLENNQSMPDELACPVIFQDGTAHIYRVPVLKVQCYTLEEIREKHLCILLPFLPLKFRPRIKSKNKKIQKGELTDFYQQIILVLQQEVADGYLTENNQKAVLSLLRKSMIRVFYRDESLLKEVITLTEPVLELEFEAVERLKRELIAERKSKEKELAELRETKRRELAELRETKKKELEAERRKKEKELEAERRKKEKELEAERRQKEKELAAERRQKEKELEAERRQKEKELAAERKQKEKELEAERRQKETELEAERRQKEKELAAEREQKEAYREELERLKAELAKYQSQK